MNQRTAPQHLKPDSHGLSINGDAGRAGSRCVREVQLALNRALGLRLSPTGYLDAPSRSALRSYQRRCGLPATGRLGPGTRLAIKSAVIEVTAEPHTGCSKFVERFGVDAMQFVNSRERAGLHLRGINARVVRPGALRVGDTISKL